MLEVRSELENQVAIFKNESGDIEVSVKLSDETVWLSLNQLTEVFGRDKSVISRHLSNIFKEGELEQESTVAKFATVQMEGVKTVTRQIEYYNLDAIISVGYRVNSKRGVEFRCWASGVLKEYLIKGYMETKAQRIFQLIMNKTMPLDQFGFYTEEMLYKDILDILQS